MKFAKWINPKTNEVRVYINGAASGFKVFAKDGGDCGCYPAGHVELVVRSADARLIGQSQIDEITNEIDRFVDENRPQQPSPWVCPKFNDYLALAE